MAEVLYYNTGTGEWELAGTSEAIPSAISASIIKTGTLSSERLPVIPIEKGGTGAITSEQALINLGAISKTTLTFTIASGSWADNTVNISDENIKIDSDIIVTYVPDYKDDYKEAGVYGYSQADGILTLKCINTPVTSIGVNILILN